MSYRPHGLARFSPTGGSKPFEFSLYQQYSPSLASSSPWDHAVVVPARQAYSHSASLAKRMTSLSVSSVASRMALVASAQKRFASSHVTISTALRRPFHLLG